MSLNRLRNGEDDVKKQLDDAVVDPKTKARKQMSYHHRIDPKPVPEQVSYINEPWIADGTRMPLQEGKFEPEELIDKSPDNVCVYIPLDISHPAVMRRLYAVIQRYGEANEENEFAFEADVCRLVTQVEIYDQIHYVRGNMEGKHSEEGRNLIRDFVAQLKEIPDGCAELFPFELIDELEEEYDL